MILWPIIVVTTSFLLFWMIEKVLHLIDYRQERRTVRLRDNMMVAETAARQETAQYYRARTWEVFRNSQRGKNFTEKEIQTIDEMGLSGYLDDNSL